MGGVEAGLVHRTLNDVRESLRARLAVRWWAAPVPREREREDIVPLFEEGDREPPQSPRPTAAMKKHKGVARAAPMKAWRRSHIHRLFAL
jgi:hypothetical protein